MPLENKMKARIPGINAGRSTKSKAKMNRANKSEPMNKAKMGSQVMVGGSGIGQ